MCTLQVLIFRQKSTETQESFLEMYGYPIVDEGLNHEVASQDSVYLNCRKWTEVFFLPPIKVWTTFMLKACLDSLSIICGKPFKLNGIIPACPCVKTACKITAKIFGKKNKKNHCLTLQIASVCIC